MNTCEALLKVLSDYGAERIFGIPGDAINHLVEATSTIQNCQETWCMGAGLTWYYYFLTLN